ncbi:hypothetical protein PUV54_03075 [Hyphococcus flavus]|uniref:Tetratricopeptide repeat protein n=1 Tax=Hyphococcus flavus TaxID=1866326 RepID=A0AAF0CGH0_9PROT|nr:hypothetical protein [Hyphococcus flavus]WDI32173.1 hypothetical protein PUV54_03075 [Hyphococcus flavus]
MRNFLSELRRRNVFRVAGAYGVAGWLLAQVAATLEGAVGLPAWFDGMVVSLLLIGFPIALILAWAFELTPEGVKLTAAAPDGEGAAPKTAKALDYAIIGGLIFVAMLIVADRLMPEKSPAVDTTANSEPAAASIAVLPFADLSPSGDQEYFSDGIAEEILNVLVRIDGLEVTSRTSSFQFKGQELGVPEIAERLTVRHVLEGSVRKAGDTIRITAQLIDARTDAHLWSDTFDRPLTAANIFAIQDEIAEAIVEALSEVMGVAAPPEINVTPVTDNVAAYDLFLKAREYYVARTRLDEVEALLARATEQDPNFADAWALHAAVISLFVEYGYAPMTDWDEHVRKNREFADRALSLDPDNAIAIAAKANARSISAQKMHSKEDFADIISEFKRALAINPRDGSTLNWLGLTYNTVGERERGLEQFQACLKYEPFYAPCAENIYDAQAALGMADEAWASYQHSLDKGLVTTSWTNFGLLAKYDNAVAFKIAANKEGMLQGYRRHDELYDAFKNIDADHGELAKDALSFARLKNQDSPGENLALLLTPLGAYDLTPLPAVTWLPELRNYRQSEQFKNYIRRSGVYDYWRKVGFPPQCKPRGENDFACE